MKVLEIVIACAIENNVAFQGQSIRWPLFLLGVVNLTQAQFFFYAL